MENPLINFLALGAIVIYGGIPPILIFIHRTIGFWRRLGTKSYYVFVFMFGLFYLGIFLVVLEYQNTLLGWRIYDNSLALVGLVPLVVGIALGVQSIRTLSFKTLVGMPEIDTARSPSTLVESGIYHYIRHPRYLEFILESIGIAILSGLLVSFIFAAYLIVGLFLVTRFEEEELVLRFGTKYEFYRKHTGRFFPKTN